MRFSEDFLEMLKGMNEAKRLVLILPLWEGFVGDGCYDRWHGTNLVNIKALLGRDHPTLLSYQQVLEIGHMTSKVTGSKMWTNTKETEYTLIINACYGVTPCPRKTMTLAWAMGKGEPNIAHAMVFAEKNPALLQLLKHVIMIGQAHTMEALVALGLTFPMAMALHQNAALKYDARLVVSEDWDSFRHQEYFPNPEPVRETGVWRYAVSTMDLERAQKALDKELSWGFEEVCWRTIAYAARPKKVRSQNDINLVSQVWRRTAQSSPTACHGRGPSSWPWRKITEVQAILNERGGTDAIAIFYSERFCDIFRERVTEYGVPEDWIESLNGQFLDRLKGQWAIAYVNKPSVQKC